MDQSWSSLDWSLEDEERTRSLESGEAGKSLRLSAEKQTTPMRHLGYSFLSGKKMDHSNSLSIGFIFGFPKVPKLGKVTDQHLILGPPNGYGLCHWPGRHWSAVSQTLPTRIKIHTDTCIQYVHTIETDSMYNIQYNDLDLLGSCWLHYIVLLHSM